MIRYGLILMLVCLCASLVLAVTYEGTRVKIEEQKSSEVNETLKNLFKEADNYVRKKLNGLAYYEAVSKNNVIGYCLKVSAKGYGGPIDMLVGITKEGIITGVVVMSNQETPGLGSRISEIKTGEKEPWFLAQFKNKDARQIELGKDINAITGATISSRAVLDGVKGSVKKFLETQSK